MTDIFFAGSIYCLAVWGHIADENDNEHGNVFTVASNEYAEFNIFLDHLAAEAAFDSKLYKSVLS